MLAIYRKPDVVLVAAAGCGAGRLVRRRQRPVSHAHCGLSVAAVAIATVLAAGSSRNNSSAGNGSSDQRVSVLTGISTASACQILAAVQAPPGSSVQPAAGERFASAPGGLRPLFPAAIATEQKPASVMPPQLCSAALHLADVATGAAVDISTNGALPVAAQTAGSYLVCPGGFGAAGTVLHRALPGGSEDFISLSACQATPEVDYSLALGAGVAGPRLVGGAPEVLDASGAPGLHVSALYIVGADGTRTDGVLAVTDYSVDGDPSAPWGRPVAVPGASTCTARVTWPDAAVAYPAIVAPRWTKTGSMGTAWFEHALLLLSTGKALRVGGRSTTSGKTFLATAELYEPTSGTWSATGSVACPRPPHAAQA